MASHGFLLASGGMAIIVVCCGHSGHLLKGAEQMPSQPSMMICTSWRKYRGSLKRVRMLCTLN